MLFVRVPPAFTNQHPYRNDSLSQLLLIREAKTWLYIQIIVGVRTDASVGFLVTLLGHLISVARIRWRCSSLVVTLCAIRTVRLAVVMRVDAPGAPVGSGFAESADVEFLVGRLVGDRGGVTDVRPVLGDAGGDGHVME